MKCQCGGELRVVHTHQAGEGAETRDHRCEECGMRYSSVTFLLERPQRPTKGHGYSALAKMVLRGELVVKKTDPRAG
jgi:hypothetical protein